ncbi:MAG: GGDEF domain-containing response regulator, partial [Nitrospirales bacterium]
WCAGRLAQDGTAMAILIVDNSAEERALMRSILEQARFTDVLDVASAEAALDILPSEGSRVELILMDILLSGMNGIDACRRIKSTRGLAHIPIVMVSEKNDDEGYALAFAAGAAEYVAKPIAKSDLLFRVRSVLQRKKDLTHVETVNREVRTLRQKLEQIRAQLTHQEYLAKGSGVLTRREFEDSLDQEWRRALREAGTFSVILVDLDGLKAFNERYGVDAGDRYLLRVGKVLKEALRTKSLRRRKDVVAHDQGDQFLILLPDTPLTALPTVLDRIHAALATKVLPPRAGILALRASLGYAAYPDHGQAKRHILLHAQAGLCRAKEQGGNCSCTTDGCLPDQVGYL